MTDRTHHLLPGHEVLSRNGPKIGAKWIRDPVISEYSGDRIVITTSEPVPEPPPPPPPPPATTGRTFYLAPNGSDSASGALSAPWRTILFASSKLLPGDTLLVRGGTYSGQGGYNWKSSGEPGKPVTIQSYPGEDPSFLGQGQSHAIIAADRSHVVIAGLTFSGFGMGPSGDGAILLLRTQGIVIEHCWFQNNGVGFQQDHHIYVNSGCRDLTIRRNYFRGTPGAAVHIYHDPGPLNVVIEDNEMHDGYWGVVVGSNANGVKIDRNVFSGNNVNIDNQLGSMVTVDGVPLAKGARR